MSIKPAQVRWFRSRRSGLEEPFSNPAEAAHRLIGVQAQLPPMKLVRQGVACRGADHGNQSGFVHREHWLPDLAWSPPSPEGAFPELVLRYLATYGPAEARDLAFWYGTTIAPSRWPVRLLYRFDPLVLAAKDKSWLIDQEHYKKVWLPSAHIAAVLLVGGRIAGTWRCDRKAKGLHVRPTPFAGLSRRVLEAAEQQATALAGFLDLPLDRFDGSVS